MKLTPDDDIRYIVQIGEGLRGPLSAEGLESLAYLKQISPDTPVRRDGEEAFSLIKDTPLLERLFPKLAAQASPAHWPKPGTTGGARYDRKHYSFREARFEKVNQGKSPQGKIEVSEILGEVRRMERDAGLDFVRENRFRISRRTIDFWIMLLLGNGLLLGGAIFMGSMTSFVWAFGGMGLFTFGLLWSMYGVMGKY